MQTTEALLLLVQVHCTVNFVLHPGGGAHNYLNYAVKQIAQLREMGLCNVQQGQGIGHTSLFKPVPSLGALVCGEAEYLIGDHNLFIGPPLLLDLVIDVKQFIQCEKEHLWAVAVSHYIFVA